MCESRRFLYFSLQFCVTLIFVLFVLLPLLFFLHVPDTDQNKTNILSCIRTIQTGTACCLSYYAGAAAAAACFS